MGAWGTGALENDAGQEALDLCQLEQFDWVAVALTVARAQCESGRLDSDLGALILGLAEILAFLGGHSEEALSHEVPPEVEFDEEMLNEVLDMMDPIVDPERSELAQLWAESDHYGAWQEDVEDLKRRLLVLSREGPGERPVIERPRRCQVGDVYRVEYNGGTVTAVVLFVTSDGCARLALPYDPRLPPRLSIARNADALVFIADDYPSFAEWPLVDQVDVGDVAVLTRYQIDKSFTEGRGLERWLLENDQVIGFVPSGEEWEYVKAKPTLLGGNEAIEGIMKRSSRDYVDKTLRISEKLLRQFREQVESEAEDLL